MILICAVIAADTPAATKEMTAVALAAGAGAFEVRLDAFAEMPDALSFLLADRPVIATFRSETLDEERCLVFAKALDAGAAYVDIESGSVLRNAFPKDRVICSYHDFAKTPSSWEILRIFCDLSTSGVPKAAFMVRGPADLLEIWKAALVLQQSGGPFILIGMGVAGEITRIRAATLNPWSVTVLSGRSLPRHPVRLQLPRPQVSASIRSSPRSPAGRWNTRVPRRCTTRRSAPQALLAVT